MYNNINIVFNKDICRNQNTITMKKKHFKLIFLTNIFDKIIQYYNVTNI